MIEKKTSAETIELIKWNVHTNKKNMHNILVILSDAWI